LCGGGSSACVGAGSRRGKAAKISRLRRLEREFAHTRPSLGTPVKGRMPVVRKKHPPSPNLPIVTSGCRPTLKPLLGPRTAIANQKICHD
jgi:hypothetical protein